MFKTTLRLCVAGILLTNCGHALRAGEILDGPLAPVNIAQPEIKKDGRPTGTLTVGWFGPIAPKWFDPVTVDQTSATASNFKYLVLDSLIKTMPQGLLTYSLAELAEVSADYKTVGFRLRGGLKFQDGMPLTTADVRWNYENYQGVEASRFKRFTERVEVKDARTIIFHFKQPFRDFLYYYNGLGSGAGWIVPRHYYERVGPEGFARKPMGSGPFKLVSQVAEEIRLEAWDEYWRRPPGVKTLIFKSVQSPATGLAALKTGELDVASNMGPVVSQVMADKRLRYDRNITSPWILMFPNWEDPESPFRDKRVRQAISLALNRAFLVQQGTQGLGRVWGNWVSSEYPDGANLPIPEYNPERGKQLLVEAGYPNGLQLDGLIAFPLEPGTSERVANDLRAVGIRTSLQIMDMPRYLATRAQGRKAIKSKSTILMMAEQVPGPAAMMIEKFALCAAPGSFACDSQIEALWKKYQDDSTSAEDRVKLSREIQERIITEFIAVPIYLNSFTQAIGPRVLPEGDAPDGEGFHRYWGSPLSAFPFPWEDWEVKG